MRSWILPFFHSFLIIFFTHIDIYGQDSNKVMRERRGSLLTGQSCQGHLGHQWGKGCGSWATAKLGKVLCKLEPWTHGAGGTTGGRCWSLTRRTLRLWRRHPFSSLSTSYLGHAPFLLFSPHTGSGTRNIFDKYQYLKLKFCLLRKLI